MMLVRALVNLDKRLGVLLDGQRVFLKWKIQMHPNQHIIVQREKDIIDWIGRDSLAKITSILEDASIYGLEKCNFGSGYENMKGDLGINGDGYANMRAAVYKHGLRLEDSDGVFVISAVIQCYATGYPRYILIFPDARTTYTPVFEEP
jgi:hypothetical protein